MSRVWIWQQSELASADWLKLDGGPWNKTVLKPNWVRDYNELDRLDPLRLAETVTSPELLLEIARQVPAKKVVIADAPQFDADWERLWHRLKLDEVLKRGQALGIPELEIRDLRQEVVRTDENGIILDRHRKMGDPEGYRVVDVGERSAFARSGFDFRRIRGADYDAEETIRHHSGGKHEYCIAATILNADLVIDVPKVKTHKKSAVTLCLKNLVGINGNKNYLPHHRAGRPEDGGDEFPGGGGNLYRRVRAWALDKSRPLLSNPAVLPLIRQLRAIDMRTRPAHLVRNGNWWGNDTIWRTVVDLNRVLVYADRDGALRDRPQRQVFHVLDGIVAGEGDGPLAPERKDLGVVLCSDDAVAADMVAAALMGFNPLKIPVIRHALEPHPLPITRLGPSGEGLEIIFEGRSLHDWRQLPSHRFKPHPGWAGRIERDDSTAFGRAAGAAAQQAS